MGEYMPEENYQAPERTDSVLKELKKKTESGNFIRSVGVGVVTVIGAASLVIQAQNMQNNERSMSELNRRFRNYRQPQMILQVMCMTSWSRDVMAIQLQIP